MTASQGKLARECRIAGERARSMRISGFRWTLEGDVVTLEGAAATPEAIDSAAKLFQGTAASAVRNLIRHAPPDPARPGAAFAPSGYVHVVELGPHATRLVETQVWEVGPDDTLAKIAQVVYGDAARAGRIAQANRSQLGPTGFVRVGQKLKIPPA